MVRTKNKRGSVEAVLECAGLLSGVISDEEAEDIKRIILKCRRNSTKKLLEKVQD